jgi:hypothetical protein
MSGGGETAGGRGEVSSSRGWGEADSTHMERESGAVSNDRKLSVGFCYEFIFSAYRTTELFLL